MPTYEIKVPDGTIYTFENVPEGVTIEEVRARAAEEMRQRGLTKPIKLEDARRLPSGVRFRTELGEYVTEEGGKAKQTFELPSTVKPENRERAWDQLLKARQYRTQYLENLAKVSAAAGAPLGREDLDEIARAYDEGALEGMDAGKAERFGRNVRESFKNNNLLGLYLDTTSEAVANRPVVIAGGATTPPAVIQYTPEQRRAAIARRARQVGGYAAMPDFEGFLEGTTALVGQLVGAAASPENILPIGLGTKAARAAEMGVPSALRAVRQAVATGDGAAVAAARNRLGNVAQVAATEAGINAALDPLTQLGAMGRGEQAEYDPMQTLAAAGLGATIGGIGQGVVEGVDLRRAIGQNMRIQDAAASVVSRRDRARLAEETDLARAADEDALATMERQSGMPAPEERMAAIEADRVRLAEEEKRLASLGMSEVQGRVAQERINRLRADIEARSAAEARQAAINERLGVLRQDDPEAVALREELKAIEDYRRLAFDAMRQSKDVAAARAAQADQPAPVTGMRAGMQRQADEAAIRQADVEVAAEKEAAAAAQRAADEEAIRQADLEYELGLARAAAGRARVRSETAGGRLPSERDVREAPRGRVEAPRTPDQEAGATTSRAEAEAAAQAAEARLAARAGNRPVFPTAPERLQRVGRGVGEEPAAGVPLIEGAPPPATTPFGIPILGPTGRPVSEISLGGAPGFPAIRNVRPEGAPGIGIAEAVAAPPRPREVPPVRVSPNRALTQSVAKRLLQLPFEDVSRGLPGKQYAAIRQDILRRLTGRTYPLRDATAARTNEALRARYPGTDEEFVKQLSDASKSRRKGDPQAFQRMPLTRWGESDLLNEIAAQGGIRRSSELSAKGGEWDGLRERGLDKDRWVRRLLRPRSSVASQPDQLFEELNATGRYNFQSIDEMWDAIEDAARRRNMSDEEALGSPPDAASDPEAFDRWQERALELRLRKQEAEEMERLAETDGRYMDEGDEPPIEANDNFNPDDPFAVARGNLAGSIAEPVAGGVIGYGMGDTPEERERYALMGAAAGMGIARAAAGATGRLGRLGAAAGGEAQLSTRRVFGEVPRQDARITTRFRRGDTLDADEIAVIDKQYRKMAERAGIQPTDLERHVGGGNAAVWSPYNSEDYVVGQFIGPVFTVSHFAPKNAKSGVDALLDLLNTETPVAFAVPLKMASQLERLGYKVSKVAVPMRFRDEVVEKFVAVNDAVTEQDFNTLARWWSENAPEGALGSPNVAGLLAGSPAPAARVPQTETPAFRRWFGNSKVVDEQGNPLRVYHGTNADFTEFKPNEALGGGIFFSPDPNEAGAFASARGARIVPVYLSAEKVWPKIVRSYDEVKTIQKAKDAGYDAIRVRDSDDGIVNWVVFSPTQIKSATGNVGTFDPNDPNILRFAAGNAASDTGASAVGAAIGYATGDTEEEKLRNAAIGAGLGFAGSRGVGKLTSAIDSRQGQRVLRAMVAEGGGLGVLANRLLKQPVTPSTNAVNAATRAAVASGKPKGPVPIVTTKPGARVNLPPPKVEMNSYDRLREYFQDSMWRAVKYVKETGASVKDRPDIDFYAAEIRMPGRIGDQIRQANEAQRSIIQDVMDTSKRLGVDDRTFQQNVQDYLVAVHAPQRNKIHGEGAALLTDAEAAAKRAEIEALPYAADVKRIAGEWRKISDNTLDILRDGGVISADTVKKLREVYPDYVPLNRIMEGEPEDWVDELAQSAAGGGGPGRNVLGTSLKRAEGSDLVIDDIRLNVMQNLESAIRTAEKNRYLETLAKFVEETPQSREMFGVRQVPIIGKNKDGVIQYAPWDKDSGAIRFRRDGKPMEITVKDKDLSAALQGLNVYNIPAWMNIAAFTLRTIGSLVTTYSPTFAPKNFARDLEDLAVNLSADLGARQGSRAPKLAAQALPVVRRFLKGERYATPGRTAKKGQTLVNDPDIQLYEQFLADGGTTGGITATLRQDRLADIANLEARYGEGFSPQKAKAVLEFFEDFNTVFENSSRFAAYKLALESYLSKYTAAGMAPDAALAAARKQAALIAKNATVNFNKQGSMGPVMKAVYLFSNPAVQGLTRTARSFIRNPKVLAGTAGTMAAGLIAMKEWNGMMNEDWRSSVSDFSLRTEMPIVIGNNEDGTPQFLRIPISHGLRPLFNLVNGLTDMIDPNAPDQTLKSAAIGFGEAMATFANPLGGDTIAQSVTPTLARPFLDVATNTRWSGGPITPEWVRRGNVTVPAKDVPAYERYWEDTPKTVSGKISTALSRGAYEALDLVGKGDYAPSPEDLRYLVSAFAGGPGRLTAQTANTVNQLVKDGTVNMRDMPILSSFISTSTLERTEALKERRTAQTEQARQALRQQYMDQLRSGEAVGAAYRELMSLPAGDARLAMARAIYAENPKLLEDIIEFHQKSEIRLSQNERTINELKVEGGYKAREIYRQLMALPQDERLATYQMWVQKKLISDEVARQMTAIHQQTAQSNAPVQANQP